ncbi:MAG: phosphoribosylaminoimidazolesuccinocarboxamide synthase [FCB group bacterium]|nr:phosphoribosylaminoimidazolesuccinocarboxamide synthase [FCB group bacterium]
MKTNIRSQLDQTLDDITLPELGEAYTGKVRNVYYQDDKIIMITTDRVSAFDHVLGTIPFKGQVLTQLARFWFDKTSEVVPNHVIDYPDPQVLVARKAEMLPVEVIVRAYITGSLWREYENGIRDQYGFVLPDGLQKDQRLPEPIITPSTKAEYGDHDLPISREEIIRRNLVLPDVYNLAEIYARKLFSIGQCWAARQGLILVDTKYEFGMSGGQLIVVDEIHTPDSSRYWVADEYEARFAANTDQRMLDKENLRQWLLAKNFSGQGTPPELTAEIRIALAEHYLTLYNRLTGSVFTPQTGPVKDRIINNLRDAGLLK